MNGRRHIVVIGGGAVGLCAAHYLLESGCDVTLLERGEIGEGSSLHNAGLVVPSHFIPLAAPGTVALGLRWMLSPESPFYIKPRLDPDLFAWLWHFVRAARPLHVEHAMPILRDLSVASLALYREIAASVKFDFQFTAQGLLMLFTTDHGREVAVKEAAQAARLGIDARVLDAGGIRALEPGVPFRAPGGVFYPGDAHLTPALFVEGLRQDLIARGAQVQTSTTVTGFVTRPMGVAAVKTNAGTFAGDEFVLAAGSWSPGLLRHMRIPLLLQPGKGYSVTVSDPAVRLRFPLLLEEARVAVTPMGPRLRFSGTMELSGLDTSVNMRRVRALLRSVPAYLGGVDPGVVERGDLWAGLRPCSPDGLPFIGRFRNFENLIAATGHAMIGISLAPITGKLVAEIVHGRIPSIDLLPLRPDRYR
ncbi:MAG TPA: FAD-dependent oxidoreductase [Bacteroidota bacterium]|nr:FAD-dependent oxidoreductase [Bacteroidota bacterium]